MGDYNELLAPPSEEETAELLARFRPPGAEPALSPRIDSLFHVVDMSCYGITSAALAPEPAPPRTFDVSLSYVFSGDLSLTEPMQRLLDRANVSTLDELLHARCVDFRGANRRTRVAIDVRLFHAYHTFRFVVRRYWSVMRDVVIHVLEQRSTACADINCSAARAITSLLGDEQSTDVAPAFVHLAERWRAFMRALKLDD